MNEVLVTRTRTCFTTGTFRCVPTDLWAKFSRTISVLTLGTHRYDSLAPTRVTNPSSENTVKVLSTSRGAWHCPRYGDVSITLTAWWPQTSFIERVDDGEPPFFILQPLLSSDSSKERCELCQVLQSGEERKGGHILCPSEKKKNQLCVFFAC